MKVNLGLSNSGGSLKTIQFLGRFLWGTPRLSWIPQWLEKHQHIPNSNVLAEDLKRRIRWFVIICNHYFLLFKHLKQNLFFQEKMILRCHFLNVFLFKNMVFLKWRYPTKTIHSPNRQTVASGLHGVPETRPAWQMETKNLKR